ncbi:hypothetical protein D3C71_1933580 [compost metagenome]
MGYDARDLLSARLAPDMQPLAKQIQFACTQARRHAGTQAREVVCRLGGQPLPSLEAPDDMNQVRALIDQTLEYLASTDAGLSRVLPRERL